MLLLVGWPDQAQNAGAAVGVLPNGASVSLAGGRVATSPSGQVRALLAGALRAVISQVLVQSKAGGRVAAREVLLNSQAVEKLILDGATAQVPIAIESGRRMGMRTQTDALVALVRDGVVSVGEASHHAPDRGSLIAALQHEGIDVSELERRA